MACGAQGTGPHCNTTNHPVLQNDFSQSAFPGCGMGTDTVVITVFQTAFRTGSQPHDLSLYQLIDSNDTVSRVPRMAKTTGRKILFFAIIVATSFPPSCSSADVGSAEGSRPKDSSSSRSSLGIGKDGEGESERDIVPIKVGAMPPGGSILDDSLFGLWHDGSYDDQAVEDAQAARGFVGGDAHAGSDPGIHTFIERGGSRRPREQSEKAHARGRAGPKDSSEHRADRRRGADSEVDGRPKVEIKRTRADRFIESVDQATGGLLLLFDRIFLGGESHEFRTTRSHGVAYNAPPNPYSLGEDSDGFHGGPVAKKGMTSDWRGYGVFAEVAESAWGAYRSLVWGGTDDRHGDGDGDVVSERDARLREDL